MKEGTFVTTSAVAVPLPELPEWEAAVAQARSLPPP